MQQSSNNTSSKVPLIIMVIAILLSVGYYFYSAGNVSTNTDSALSVVGSNHAVGANVLSLLNQIHSLKIDTTFFKTPVYQSLIDFSVVIPPENVGKANPFISF